MSDMRLPLNEVYDCLGLRNANGDMGMVRGVSIDTRTLNRGMLFFALAGENHDGHTFVDEAIAKGACAVVVQEGFRPQSLSIPFMPVDDPLRALQVLAAYYRNKFDFPVIAITGSNGKTTTKEMLSHVLSAKWQVSRSIGNLNNHIGLPLSIFEWSEATEIAVLEMGTNHFGEIKRLCEIAQPTHGILTNIGKAHLEHFNNRKGVLQAKSELLDYLTEGTIFINGDDTMLASLLDRYPDAVVYGFSEQCQIRGGSQGLDKQGFPWFTVESQKVQLNIPGRHNIYNALAVIAVARELGISWDHIKTELYKYQSYDMRMEVDAVGDLILVNDCYNANPDSLYQALLTLNDLNEEGRKVAVLGDMLELGPGGIEAHEQIAAWMIELELEALFGFGDMMAIAVKQARRSGFNTAFHYNSKQDLLKELTAFLQPGDIVLVKGSRSMHMEEIVTGIQTRFERG